MDGNPSELPDSVKRVLARIADALNLPASTFTSDAGSDALKAVMDTNQARLLAAVDAYLQAADQITRRNFIEALKARIEAEPH